ncbi:MAG TPA: hypothetical protein VKF62_05195, partial [Planctomycetota bacterium]|nr:hypothetical protein [Planctomycetota bacterium]
MKTTSLAALLLLSPPAPPVPDASAQEPAGEKVSLRLNLRPGDRFSYRYVTDIDQSTKVGGMDMGTKIRSEKEFSYTVQEVA